MIMIDIGAELYEYQESGCGMDPMESIVALEAMCTDIVNVVNGCRSKPHYSNASETIVYRSLLRKVKAHTRGVGNLGGPTCMINGDNLIIAHS